MEMRLRAPVTRGYFFFSPAPCTSLTRLRREISIRKKYPLEPRVVVNKWLYNCDIWYSFSVFVFGLEFETQLSHYETHCSKRFLLKSLLTARRRDVAIWPNASNRRLKSLLLSEVSSC